MAITTVITCDECGKQKGEVNHWFSGYKEGNCYFGITKRIVDDDESTRTHLCGRECLMKAINKWLEEK